MHQYSKYSAFLVSVVLASMSFAAMGPNDDYDPDPTSPPYNIAPSGSKSWLCKGNLNPYLMNELIPATLEEMGKSKKMKPPSKLCVITPRNIEGKQVGVVTFYNSLEELKKCEIGCEGLFNSIPLVLIFKDKITLSFANEYYCWKPVGKGLRPFRGSDCS